MQAPILTSIHHVSPTVSDVEASAAWYQRVLGMERADAPVPHWGTDRGGYSVVLTHPAGFAVALSHHEHDGAGFDERNTGLDHIAFGVRTRDDLDRWAAWLDACTVAHTGVVDVYAPVPYSAVGFRDPDGIRLEVFHTVRVFPAAVSACS